MEKRNFWNVPNQDQPRRQAQSSMTEWGHMHSQHPEFPLFLLWHKNPTRNALRVRRTPANNEKPILMPRWRKTGVKMLTVTSAETGQDGFHIPAQHLPDNSMCMLQIRETAHLCKAHTAQRRTYHLEGDHLGWDTWEEPWLCPFLVGNTGLVSSSICNTGLCLKEATTTMF